MSPLITCISVTFAHLNAFISIGYLFFFFEPKHKVLLNAPTKFDSNVPQNIVNDVILHASNLR